MHLHGPEYETDFPRIREDFHTKLVRERDRRWCGTPSLVVAGDDTGSR